MGGRERRCCLCGFEGDKSDVRWCRVCEHNFCKHCRKNWWDRGMAAVKEFVTNVPPLYCQVKGHNERNT